MTCNVHVMSCLPHTANGLNPYIKVFQVQTKSPICWGSLCDKERFGFSTPSAFRKRVTQVPDPGGSRDL